MSTLTPLLATPPSLNRLYGFVSAVQDALLGGVDYLHYSLLNDFQRGLPLTARPWAAVGRAIGEDEATVIAELTYLKSCGKVSRVGAVFAPRSVGASTLAALQAPAHALEDIAAIVSAQPEVNHNYLREHAFNLWFVVTAPSRERVAETLARIEAQTGCAVISLPMEEEFHIDLGFDLSGLAPRKQAVRRIGAAEPRNLSGAERSLMAVLEDGLEFVPRPFARLGMRAGMTENQVLIMLRRWLDEGLVKRLGVVVNHHALGYGANAMCVWNVPEARVAELGTALAGEPCVTLCYRRARAGESWPYNLYCMIHGQERGEVLALHAELNRRLRLAGFAHEILFSVRRFKQTGARYASL